MINVHNPNVSRTAEIIILIIVYLLNSHDICCISTTSADGRHDCDKNLKSVSGIERVKALMISRVP